MYSALGKNGQIINVVPSQKLVMVRIGNIPQSAFVPNFFNDEIWQKFNLLNCSSTSVNSAINKSVLFYPNPAQNELTIENLEQNSRIEIMDNIGNLIFAQSCNANRFKINTQNFAHGIYTIRISGSSMFETRKFIVLR